MGNSFSRAGVPAFANFGQVAESFSARLTAGAALTRRIPEPLEAGLCCACSPVSALENPWPGATKARYHKISPPVAFGPGSGLFLPILGGEGHGQGDEFPWTCCLDLHLSRNGIAKAND